VIFRTFTKQRSRFQQTRESANQQMPTMLGERSSAAEPAALLSHRAVHSTETSALRQRELARLCARKATWISAQVASSGTRSFCRATETTQRTEVLDRGFLAQRRARVFCGKRHEPFDGARVVTRGARAERRTIKADFFSQSRGNLFDSRWLRTSRRSALSIRGASKVGRR
jgi:hypothetical protein